MAIPESAPLPEAALECCSHTDGSIDEKARQEALNGMEARTKLDQEGRKADQSSRKPSVEFVWFSGDPRMCTAVADQESNECSRVIARDDHGRIIASASPDGVTYEFCYPRDEGKRDRRDLYSWGDEGIVTDRVIISNSQTGDYVEWVQERPWLWRMYQHGEPTLSVLDGHFEVDEQGVLHMHGKRSELPVNGAPRDYNGTDM